MNENEHEIDQVPNDLDLIVRLDHESAVLLIQNVVVVVFELGLLRLLNASEVHVLGKIRALLLGEALASKYGALLCERIFVVFELFPLLLALLLFVLALDLLENLEILPLLYAIHLHQSGLVSHIIMVVAFNN